MNWTRPKVIALKVAITVLLAVLAWYFFGGGAEAEPQGKVVTNVFVSFEPPPQDTTLEFLRSRYNEYNTAYFQGKLPTDTAISFDPYIVNMADTGCNNDGTGDCVIRFNLKYVLAPRVSENTLLHEMCHIKTWTKTQQDTRPEGVDSVRWDHNKYWRACMLTLDAQDAFRQINIDFYGEK